MVPQNPCWAPGGCRSSCRTRGALDLSNNAELIASRLAPLVVLIGALTVAAAAFPLIFTAGPGPAEHLVATGKLVRLYGYGPYRNMSADVAVQGLAQDVVTLLAGPALVIIPVLLAGSLAAAYLTLGQPSRGHRLS